MHAKVRRESVAGYATDETFVCGPKGHTRWWQRYRGHLQGLLYRLILNSYLYLLLQSCLSSFHTVNLGVVIGLFTVGKASFLHLLAAYALSFDNCAELNQDV